MRSAFCAVLVALLVMVPAIARSETAPASRPLAASPPAPVKAFVRTDLAAASAKLEDQLKKDGASQVAGRNV
ncbi:MAG: hypothetical protein HC900_02540, partial [Methylacidiphilales bacterium]|nr:hypothetical protein [Candidatus Methylacidiphilales bacterium]